jgi:hypothetical protein
VPGPFPDLSTTAEVCSTIRAQVELFALGGPLACPNNMAKYVSIAINKCYDSDDSDAPGLGKIFTSFRMYRDGPFAVPANMICEGKAFFEEKCAGAGVVTDNFKEGLCVNSYQSPATNMIVPTGAKSFRYDCCVPNGDRTACAPLFC